MKTKIIAFGLCFALLLSSVLSLTVSAENVIQQTTPPGALVISEVYNPDSDYQFIEIVNTSTKEVALSDYYLYRFGATNQNDNFKNQFTYLTRMIGSADPANAPGTLVKLHLNTTATIPAEGTCVVWLTTNSTATVASFKEEYGITSDTVNIAIVNVTAATDELTDIDGKPDYKASSININYNGTAANYATLAGDYFLPIDGADCVLSLINKNVTFDISKIEGDSQNQAWSGASKGRYTTIATSYTAVTDPLLKDKEWDGTTGRFPAMDFYNRMSAADCNVLLMDQVDGMIHSRNYYTFVDAEKAVVGGITKLAAKQINPNIAVGKLNTEGTYAEGAGLRKYNTSETATTPFLDDGTYATTATPGALAEGQFDYYSADTRVLGAQNKLSTDGKTQDVRVVGYINNVKSYKEVGFEIFATNVINTWYGTTQYSQTDLTLDDVCKIKATTTQSINTVYGSITANDASVSVGQLTGNSNESGHLMVFAITGLPVADEVYTEGTAPITIYVTPYAIDENGVKVYGKRVAIDLQMFDALNETAGGAA